MRVNEKQFEEKTGYALSKFYADNFNKLTYFLNRYVKDEEVAKNLTNDTFIRSLEQIDKFDKEKACFTTWLFHMGKNIALQYLKIESRIPTSSMDYDYDGFTLKEIISDSGPTKREDIIKKKYDYVKDAINEMPEKYKNVIVMRELENMTYQEIEDYTGLPEGTVKSQIRKGRQILMKKCKNHLRMIDEME